MEPITHALTSLALARATQKQLPRFGAAILIVSGVAADLDYLSYFGGAEAFLRFHRTLLHSLPGSLALVCVITGIFFWADRRRLPKINVLPLGFAPALSVACLGVACHLALDFASGEGVQLLWPFRVRSVAWNFATNIDPWILILLIAGLLLPGLFHMVSEEIGEPKTANGGRRAAVITLLILLAYLGVRGTMHHRAVNLLLSREYHERTPVLAGAFPQPMSPLDWRGVAVTYSTVEQVSVSLAPGIEFDPSRSLTHFKPQESPVLDAGESASAVKKFLGHARFPLASVYPLEDGSRLELHDLQFAPDDTSLANIFVRVDFDTSLRIKRQEFLFSSSRSR